MNFSAQTLSHINRAAYNIERARRQPAAAAFWLVEASIAARNAADLHHAHQLKVRVSPCPSVVHKTSALNP